MPSDVTITVRDGQLGQLPASTANASMKIGVCSDGIVGQLYSFADNSAMQTSIGQGPLVDASAQVIGVAGGPVYMIPINPSSAGSASAVGHTGSGAGAIAVSFAPRVPVAVKITTGGINGVAAIAISVNGSVYGTPIATTGGTFTYAVPGTLTSVILASGQTWVLNDVYTIGTDGAVTLAGSGPAASNVTHTSSPLDAYAVLVTIATSGALGAGVFTYSLDGGNTPSGQILIPSGAKYVIPNAGVVLTFSSTFVATDTYSFTTTTAGFSNSDVTAAVTLALASPVQWDHVHLVGTAANAAGAAATAAVLDTLMTTAFTQYRFTYAVSECPQTESDATIAAAFTSFVSLRVSVCVTDAALVSPLNGLIRRRNLAWAYTARLCSIIPGKAPSHVGLGALPNVRSIYRDEAKTPLLDAARFTTARTYFGTPGYFITQGNMMAPPGSDFNRVQRRRAMDLACQIVRQAELPYLNGSLRVDLTDGTIDEREASIFEGKVNDALTTGVVNTGNASGASVVVDRSANVLSTNTMPVSVSIVPLFTAERITTSIGFSNPALLAA